ncbi:TRAP transporter small permease [Clostridium estertheticum]|uniref:TRAP transporter small permease n=1 Tax=Clostridium estertheticum TaxID=238834 RepID=UPI001C0C1306|nr:TRAP transporter small permease [Clostridium estertheticum]MBU3176037.1 TRAP transporter small permease [Clostridium estertheticum]
MSIFKKVLNKIDKAIEYICMATLVILVCIVFYQVFTRYILGFTPRWSEETAVILMIWLGFITTAIGVKEGTHLSISALVNFFPKIAQKIIFYFDELAVMLFGIILFIYGKDLTMSTMGSTLPATQLPSGVLYAVLPVAGVMIIFYTIIRILNLITDKQI